MKKILYSLIVIGSIALIVWFTKNQIQDYRQEVAEIKERMAEQLIIAEEPVPDYSEYLERAVVFGEGSQYDYVKDDWSSVDHYVCAVRHKNDVGRPSDFAVDRFACVQVTDLDTGEWVHCMVTDYGPDPDIFPERVVDLSAKSFLQLAPLSQGLIKNVSVEEIDCEDMIKK